MQTIENSSFLLALKGQNQKKVPVWFMRQAGRFLPSYREFRKKHSLLDLFFTPDLAAKITLLPVQELGVDAAILFSDITVVALSLGQKLDFQEGPRIEPLFDIKAMQSCSFFDLTPLEPIFQTIEKVKKESPVPLIGFCGAPFTVASYLVEGGEASLKEMMRKEPKIVHHFFDLLTKLSIAYLLEQKKRGIDAFQLFDTWICLLSQEEVQEFALPYYRQIFEKIDLPGILFGKSLSSYLDFVVDLPCALSLDSSISLAEVRKKTGQTLQGNLDPDLLFKPLEEIEKKVRELKEEMQEDSAWILGLGHGIKPNTPVDAVRKIVEILKKIE